MRTALISVGIVGLLASSALGLTSATADGRDLPRCEEDEVIAGRGNFERGRWSRYVCAHPDDITAETIENDYRNPAVNATVAGSVCAHPRFWWNERQIAIHRDTCSSRRY